PSRTGLHVTVDTYARLARHENIAALKDATGNLERAVLMRQEIGDALPLYAGSDGVTVPMLSVGAVGVISVVSNLLPEMTVQMCRAWFAGDSLRAAEMQCRMAPLIRALFSEVNPIPVKAVLAALGYCSENYRLPLCEMEAEDVEALVREYHKLTTDR
ncbi:MAG: dihydrodipicolinate synthase family protein, partial [Clostridia bacterium]|nr:dihydrodipicolinate synthase family protein [Clostridia bacterium]